VGGKRIRSLVLVGRTWTYGDVPGQGVRGEGGRAAWRWRGHPGSRRRRSAPPAPADEVDGGHGETRRGGGAGLIGHSFQLRQARSTEGLGRRRRRFDWLQLVGRDGE
jgi:hypothetical protein